MISWSAEGSCKTVTLLPEEVMCWSPRSQDGESGTGEGREMWPEDSSALSPLKLDLEPALPPS